MATAILEQDKTEKLTDEQKRAILEAYSESLNDEGIDAFAAIEKIRVAHSL